MNKLNRIRQGDVGLYKIDKLPENVKKEKGSILALGESTGHRHEFVEGKWQFWTDDKKRYIEVLEPSLLTHAEHHNWKMLSDGAYIPHTGMILPGVYEQVKEREHDYIEETTKTVID